MTATDQLNDILDRLDADAAPDVYELAQLLKVLISNIEISHAQLRQEVRELELRIEAIEKSA